MAKESVQRSVAESTNSDYYFDQQIKKPSTVNTAGSGSAVRNARKLYGTQDFRRGNNNLQRKFISQTQLTLA